MTEVSVRPTDGGQVEFAVSWAEPLEATFETRAEAEQFAAWARSSGRAVHADGGCAPCAAHHQHAHLCPSCQADLSLRVGFSTGANHAPRSELNEPDRFLIPREQARIRAVLATRAVRERSAAWHRPAATM